MAFEASPSFLASGGQLEFADQPGHLLLGSGTVALLLGVFAGLAEKALPSTVMSRATSVITSAQQI